MIEKPRLQFLESIRGLAALSVVFYHLLLAFWPFMFEPKSPLWAVRGSFLRWLANSPMTSLVSGPFAVTIFFVLSGFVLSYSFFRRGRIESIQSAAVRRYLRLALPVLLAVLGSFVLCKHRMYHNGPASALTGSHWLGAWYQFKPHLGGWGPNGAIWQGLYGAFFTTDVGYDNVLWTMAVELRGSFLVFTVLALFGRARNRWILYYIIAGLLWFWREIYMLDFLGGAVLCDAYVLLELRDKPLLELSWFSVPLLLLGFWLGRYRWLPAGVTPDDLALWQMYPSLGAILIVGVPLFCRKAKRLLDIRPIALLGRLSFGLYLTHILVLCSLGSWIYVQLRHAHQWGHGTAALVAIAATLCVSFPAGGLLYLLGDLPSIAIGQWLVNQFFLPRQQAISPTPRAARGQCLTPRHPAFF